MTTKQGGWERSFPHRQIDGHDWIVAVIADLADYCEENGLIEIEVNLRVLLSQSKGLLGRAED